MKRLRTRVSRVLIIALIIATFAPAAVISKSAEAAISPSQMMTAEGKAQARGVDEAKVRGMLENKIVAERLKAYGLSADEIAAKMSKMSDEQVHQMAALSDRMPAGGNALGFVIGVLIVALLALLVIYFAKRV
ncbi:MAG: PA2779 family protein [Deltaproteobacteria bacterium]